MGQVHLSFSIHELLSGPHRYQRARRGKLTRERVKVKPGLKLSPTSSRLSLPTTTTGCPLANASPQPHTIPTIAMSNNSGMAMSMGPPMIPGYSLRVQLFAPNAHSASDTPVRCFRVVTSPDATLREFCQQAIRIHAINYGE